MIKSNNYDEMIYDLESKIVALKTILDQMKFLPELVGNVETFLSVQEEVERLKYFSRQYCTYDRFDQLDKIRKEHSLLIDEIESFCVYDEIKKWALARKTKNRGEK